MKAEEKESTFLKFASGKVQVLISTSVVEVGVDIPEATVMIVEDAHSFGLAQLHQFRGRVGRSNLQSYCFCFSRNLDNNKSRERLRVFVQNDDGFKLAQYDLKLRGPGALLGLEQSGFSGLSSVWLENTDLILTARTVAERILPVINSNKYLYNKVKTRLETNHLE
jgi:ATP-dependent DNA helicase RecG